MSSVIHVSHRHAGVFLPAASLHDRLAVAEYVARLLRSEDTVQLLIDNERWIATLEDAASAPRCSRCNTIIQVVYRNARQPRACHCLQCALVHGAEPSAHHTECCCWSE